MTTSNRVKERIGINAVSRLVEGLWESGWQEYGAPNDDAIDGVILMRRGSKQPADTGGLVFVQVKCGGNGYRKDQKQYPNHIGVALGKAYVDEHFPRWERVPGPVVLVFVDDTVDKENPPAWWVNLRRPDSYSQTNDGIILVPKHQRLTRHSKGDFHRLCGRGPHDRQLERFEVKRSETLIPRLGKNESLRNDAWGFYKNWREDPASCTNQRLGLILVNRVGWKHLTRRDRLPERIVQSWMLLGAAKQIVKSSINVFNLGHATTQIFPDGNTQTIDYLGLRAIATFSYRQEAVIQVVLRRSRLLHPKEPGGERQKIWFYSVYELRRGSTSP